jgi:hypothetical protein
LEQSDTASTGLEREIKDRLAKRLDGIEAVVVWWVQRELADHPSADRAAVIESVISDRLAAVADGMPVATVQEFMRRDMPDDPRIDLLAKAGINREEGYVWARPLDGERTANGLFADGVAVRISIERLMRRA